MKRGEIWWASLPEPRGSEPGYRRPVLVIQSDDFNRSKLNTVLVVSITTNRRLARAPGNLLVSRKQSGLKRESVINVSQIYTIDKAFLTTRAGKLPARSLRAVDDGLRLVLSL